MNPLRILVVGQIPPPFGGQTVMVETLLTGHYEHASLTHVNVALSQNLSDMGRPSSTKAWRVVRLVMKALRMRLFQRFDVLYYHPAGANRGAILRDLAFLFVLRPLCPYTILHFHARGLIESVNRFPWGVRHLAVHAYSRPELTIAPSRVLLDEVTVLGAKRERVVPNATPGGKQKLSWTRGAKAGHLVYMNLISKAKGASWLVRAVAEVRSAGRPVELFVYGEFASPSYARELEALVAELGLLDIIHFNGVVEGQERWDVLRGGDIFCVPTSWDQESFSLVLIEAASCALPIITTDVPGVRDVLPAGAAVLLASCAEPASLAERIVELLDDEDKRAALGSQARIEFETRYTTRVFYQTMDELFAGVGTV